MEHRRNEPVGAHANISGKDEAKQLRGCEDSYFRMRRVVPFNSCEWAIISLGMESFIVHRVDLNRINERH